jgi:hypothetical protein
MGNKTLNVARRRGINTLTNQKLAIIVASTHGRTGQSGAPTVRGQRLVLTASRCSDGAPQQ